MQVTGDGSNNTQQTGQQAEAAQADRTNEDLLIAIERQKELNKLQQEQFILSGQLNEAYQKNLGLQTNLVASMQAAAKTRLNELKSAADANLMLDEFIDKGKKEGGLRAGMVKEVEALK